MTARAAFKQGDVTRAIRGVEAAGLKVAACRIVPTTGEIVIELEGVANVNRKNPLDRILNRAA